MSKSIFYLLLTIILLCQKEATAQVFDPYNSHYRINDSSIRLIKIKGRYPKFYYDGRTKKTKEYQYFNNSEMQRRIMFEEDLDAKLTADSFGNNIERKIYTLKGIFMKAHKNIFQYNNGKLISAYLDDSACIMKIKYDSLNRMHSIDMKEFKLTGHRLFGYGPVEDDFGIEDDGYFTGEIIFTYDNLNRLVCRRQTYYNSRIYEDSLFYNKRNLLIKEVAYHPKDDMLFKANNGTDTTYYTYDNKSNLIRKESTYYIDIYKYNSHKMMVSDRCVKKSWGWGYEYILKPQSLKRYRYSYAHKN